MFSKILVPVDVSDRERTARLCKQANDLAVQAGSEVRLVTVMPSFGMPLVASHFPVDAQQNVKNEFKQALSELADENFTVDKVSRKILLGKRALSITKEAEAWGADLIIVGCRRKKSFQNQKLLGSTSRAVAERASCSVLIIR